MDYYQMDLFDLIDEGQTPVEHASEHQPVIIWSCRKCGKPVGSVADGQIMSQRDECMNGHKQLWEGTSIGWFKKCDI